MAEKVSALKRNIFYGLLCWKKSYIAKLLMSGKKIISPEVWGKKNLTKPNHHGEVRKWIPGGQRVGLNGLVI